MKWYLTKLIYQITCGAGKHTPQFDEQLRLVAAANKKQALEKARHMGLKEQASFFNNKQQLVRWKFVNVTELYPLEPLLDGAEVYSTISEQTYPDGYLKLIGEKAKKLLNPAKLTALT